MQLFYTIKEWLKKMKTVHNNTKIKTNIIFHFIFIFLKCYFCFVIFLKCQLENNLNIDDQILKNILSQRMITTFSYAWLWIKKPRGLDGDVILYALKEEFFAIWLLIIIIFSVV